MIDSIVVLVEEASGFSRPVFARDAGERQGR